MLLFFIVEEVWFVGLKAKVRRDNPHTTRPLAGHQHGVLH